MNEAALQCRERLRKALEDCVARMSEAGRRAWENRGQAGPRQQSQKAGAGSIAECAEGYGSVPAGIRMVIAHAHRLSRKAEQKEELRTALQGQEVVLKALKQQESYESRYGTDKAEQLSPGMPAGERHSAWSEDDRQALKEFEQYPPESRAVMLEGFNAYQRWTELEQKRLLAERAQQNDISQNDDAASTLEATECTNCDDGGPAH